MISPNYVYYGFQPSSRFDELPDDFDPSGKLPGSFDDGDPQTTNLYVGNLSPQVCYKNCSTFYWLADFVTCRVFILSCLIFCVYRLMRIFFYGLLGDLGLLLVSKLCGPEQKKSGGDKEIVALWLL